MFDRHPPLLALLLLAAAGRAGAQDTALARLRARADSLAEEWRRATAIANVADSLQRERAAAGRDTIAAGGLRIIINASPLPVREAAGRAWPLLDSLYGGTARVLAQRPYLIRAYDPDTAARRQPLRAGIEVPWNLSVEQLTHVLLSNVPLPPPDSAFGRWLGAPVRPPLRPDHDRARVYLRLVTAPSQAARDCFVGTLAACALALGLDDGPDPFLRWYPSSPERRAVVGGLAPYLSRGATAPTLQACLDGRDEACAELLTSVPPDAIPMPLGAEARVTFLSTALRLGGRDAYRRLLARPAAPVGERLAEAAGVSRDTLLARWRAEVLAARPATVALPVWAWWTAAGWVAFFAACGLRSSRWRLG